MKNNKTKYAVNKQEDEDVEMYILYPENISSNTKYNKLQQSAYSYKERVKQSAPDNTIKSETRFVIGYVK